MKRDPVGLPQLVSLDDVRMDQVRHQLGFAHEILEEHLLAGEVRADNLDRDALDEVARPALLRFIHDAHAALKYFADDFVAEFVLDGEERHAGMVGICPAKSSLAAGLATQNTIFFLFFSLAWRGYWIFTRIKSGDQFRTKLTTTTNNLDITQYG